MTYDIQEEHSLQVEHIHVLLTDCAQIERQVSISHNMNTGEVNIYVYIDEESDIKHVATLTIP